MKAKGAYAPTPPRSPPSGFAEKEWHTLAASIQGLDHRRGHGHTGAVQILFEYTRIENTVHYLGVEVEKAVTLTEGTEI